MIAPKFAEFSKKYTDAVFIHVDVDELNVRTLICCWPNLTQLQTLPDVADVSGVPTFKYFKGGNKIVVFSGANAAKIEETIKNNL